MNKKIDIKVCTGTGGIAAGGKEILSAFEEILSSSGVSTGCSVQKVGCRGFCVKDVLVDVIVDGNKTTYKSIKPDMVERIIQEHIIDGNPVAEWATTHGVDLLQPEKPTRELADWLITEEIAVAFVMAYGHFLSRSLRAAPMHGMLNFHGSLLPKYRGASPVETALALGDSECGVALMQIVKEMDAGGVADVERVSIEATDSGSSLRTKIGQAVVPLMQRNLARALQGQLDFEAQDLSQVSFCRKITKEDAALDFTQSAERVSARLRAFSPWPGAYFDHAQFRIKVGRVEVLPTLSGAQPGTVLDCDAGVLVATGQGSLRLLELQRPGGKMLPAKEFLLGYELKVGEVLPSVTSAPLLL